MSGAEARWISEADVVALMDLPQAIDALDAGLRLQAAGQVQAMHKTQLLWNGGSTLHALGAVDEAHDIVCTKSWAHTEGGACPLLLLWSASSGALLAVFEAFALGQMRTGAMSGVATRWMARRDAESFALIGTGKQALAQLAAVAAVRPLKDVRIWGRDSDRLSAFVTRVEALGFGFSISTPATVAAATDGAAIVTLATRAREPFFNGAMAAKGAHINAIGAIALDREEFTPDVLDRAGLVAADDPDAALRLSREFSSYFGTDAQGRVRPISEIVATANGRPADCDTSVFKAMGTGSSDLALGVELHARAIAAGLGRTMPQPVRATPRLTPNHKVRL